MTPNVTAQEEAQRAGQEQGQKKGGSEYGSRLGRFLSWLGRWVIGANNFSRRHTLGFRIAEAKKEMRRRDAYVQALPPEKAEEKASWAIDQQDIAEHIQTAAAELSNANGRGSLERALREVMAAERKLIAFFPNERGAGAIADLRRDILTYVPEEGRAELQELIKQAQTALQNSKPWKDHLLGAKVEVDEILIRGYQTRERLGDGIWILGVLLVLILFILLVFIPFILKIELFQATGLTSTRALWTGALFGALGACLSGLMGFTVNRIARGDYEPFVATAIRPLIGSTSGILAAVLVASGILNFKGAEFPGLAIAAFLLGFSERLVMGTVERLSTRVETQASSTPRGP